MIECYLDPHILCFLWTFDYNMHLEILNEGKPQKVVSIHPVLRYFSFIAPLFRQETWNTGFHAIN